MEKYSPGNEPGRQKNTRSFAIVREKITIVAFRETEFKRTINEANVSCQ
jgi:hypothetical protein